MKTRIERQELYCHDCDHYVQFNLDLELNGCHVLKCPNCGHEHCRVVHDGKITDERWDSRNVSQNVYQITANVTATATSTWDLSSGSSSTNNVTWAYTYTAWMNTTTST